MLGIGIDITIVSRIADLKDKYGTRFLARVLGEGESAASVESLAGLWAAKEAVVKAMGTGYSGFGPRCIIVTKDSFGALKVSLHGRAAELARDRGIKSFHISIAHDGGLAVACAVAV